MQDRLLQGSRIEWPTVGIAALAYGGFVAALLTSQWLGGVPSAVLLTFCIALHSSLQHEILHGHPFPRPHWNEALATPALGLFIPYQRFRDTHLAHHHDPNLTDPYDDPESNFTDPAIWTQWPGWRRQLAFFNNTLLGRMLAGPVLSLLPFYAQDLNEVRQGNQHIAKAYLWHLAGVLAVGWLWLALSDAPLWLWPVTAYLALSILKIRTFLEHRAHHLARARTVIIEDRGPLAFLFLNNNLHAVHHCHPQVPWYRLWQTYEADKTRALIRNDGYYYRSYADIFRQYFLRVKDPVPHPLMVEGGLLGLGAAPEAMHPLGPLQPDQPAFHPGQHEQAQPH